MKTTLQKRLTPAEIANFSSQYLHEGRKQESWEILDVNIDGRLLTARVKMQSSFTSPADLEGFHLTIFSTLEFLSELTIIYAHVWAGYEKKSLECYMIESAIKSKMAIRDPDNIQVHMEVPRIKKLKNTMIAVTKSRIFDQQGLVEATLKGFMPETHVEGETEEPSASSHE